MLILLGYSIKTNVKPGVGKRMNNMLFLKIANYVIPCHPA
jgi:hypothetical protein